MSDRTWQERFQDVIDASVRISVYITDVSEADFYRDSKTFDAVVRNIILIGDALSGVDHGVRQYLPGVPWRSIVGMRNVLVHEYFNIEVATVWLVATEHIPPLASRLQSYLTSPDA